MWVVRYVKWIIGLNSVNRRAHTLSVLRLILNKKKHKIILIFCMEIFTSCVSWWSVGKTVTEIRIQMTYVSPVHLREISDALVVEATMQMCWETQYQSILQILVGLLCSRYGMCGFFYTPPAGYYVIPSENFERLSVSASFPDSNLSSFWPIFFELCMDIDIGEEWFGIANGLNLFINNRVMALDGCKNIVSRL